MNNEFIDQPNKDGISNTLFQSCRFIKPGTIEDQRSIMHTATLAFEDFEIWDKKYKDAINDPGLSDDIGSIKEERDLAFRVMQYWTDQCNKFIEKYGDLLLDENPNEF